jgi:hypothetical protein
MRNCLAILLMAALTGCVAGKGVTQGQLPEARTAVLPKVQIVERRVYVKIPPHLTKRSAVPEGPIPQCFEVAAQRRQVIEEQNARLEKIDTIQGTEVLP